MTSRQVILNETHSNHMFVIIQYHVADLYTDEDGTTIDEGYDYWTLEEFDLENGQLVTEERGDLEEMKELMAEAIAELEAVAV